MRSRPLAASVAVVALALAAGACGGDEEEGSSGGQESQESKDAQFAVSSFVRNLEDEDAFVICNLVSEEYREKLSGTDSSGECEDELEAGDFERLRSEFDGVEAESASIQGDVATVKLAGGGQIEVERAPEDDTRWVLSGAPE